MIAITVSYTTPTKQAEIAINAEDNCTVESAIHQSNIIAQFPEIDLLKNAVGIFGKCVTRNTIVQDGDRVEIYRLLAMDPKEARRRRDAMRNNK